MNVFRPLPTRPAPSAHVIGFPPRSGREPGTGYGRNSGYASARRYASDWLPPRFHCT